MQNKTIIFLTENLSRINYWLQFAETKNAAVVVFDTAIIVAFYTILDNMSISFFIVLMTGYMLSLIIAFISFCPFKNYINVNENDGKLFKEDNHIYWGDIAKYSIKNYKKLLYKLHYNVGKNDIVINNYISQIIINSRIAKFKYGMFQISLVLTMLSIAISLFVFIVYKN